MASHDHDETCDIPCSRRRCGHLRCAHNGEGYFFGQELSWPIVGCDRCGCEHFLADSDCTECGGSKTEVRIVRGHTRTLACGDCGGTGLRVPPLRESVVA
jgi:hypothetical protein